MPDRINVTPEDIARRERLAALLAKLPHEDYCDFGGIHQRCCPEKIAFWRACVTHDVLRELVYQDLLGDIREAMPRA